MYYYCNVFSFFQDDTYWRWNSYSAELGLKDYYYPQAAYFVYCICSAIFFVFFINFLWICSSYFINFFQIHMPCLALLCIDVILTSSCHFKTTYSSFDFVLQSTVSSFALPKELIFPENLKVPISRNLTFSFHIQQRENLPNMCHGQAHPPPFINSTNLCRIIIIGVLLLFIYFLYYY